MNKNQILNKIERRIQDLNHAINSEKDDEKKLYAWKYARIELEMIAKMFKDD